MSRPQVPLAWGVLFGLVMIWGSSFALLKVAAATIDPLWIAAMRLMVATTALWLVMTMTGRRLPPWANQATWRAYGLIGVIGTALPFVLFAAAAGRIDSTLVAICNGGSPFFTAVLAHLLLPNDRLTLRRAMGIGLGFAGLLALAGPAAFGALGPGAALGIGFGVLGAFGYGIANVATKRAPPLDALIGSTVFCLAGAVATTLLALLLVPVPEDPGLAALGAVTALGLASTALGSFAFVWLIQQRGPVFVSFATYLVPVWATLIGVVIMGERLTVGAIVALALVLAGMVLSTRTPAR